MSQIILLNDSSSRYIGIHSRYMGPYPLAFNLREKGFDVTVIDYFTRIPNFFEYLKSFVGPETLCVGLSSTFLAPVTENFRTNADASEAHDNFYLWLKTPEEIKLDDSAALCG